MTIVARFQRAVKVTKPSSGFVKSMSVSFKFKLAACGIRRSYGHHMGQTRRDGIDMVFDAEHLFIRWLFPYLD
jgi:hypothetical protein